MCWPSVGRPQPPESSPRGPGAIRPTTRLSSWPATLKLGSRVSGPSACVPRWRMACDSLWLPCYLEAHWFRQPCAVSCVFGSAGGAAHPVRTFGRVLVGMPRSRPKPRRLPIDVLWGADLRDSRLRSEILRLQKERRPRLLVIQFPCTSYDRR